MAIPLLYSSASLSFSLSRSSFQHHAQALGSTFFPPPLPLTPLSFSSKPRTHLRFHPNPAPSPKISCCRGPSSPDRILKAPSLLRRYTLAAGSLLLGSLLFSETPKKSRFYVLSEEKNSAQEASLAAGAVSSAEKEEDGEVAEWKALLSSLSQLMDDLTSAKRMFGELLDESPDALRALDEFLQEAIRRLFPAS